jgi:hypothetical protein
MKYDKYDKFISLKVIRQNFPIVIGVKTLIMIVVSNEMNFLFLGVCYQFIK